jgi:protein ImuB
VDRLACVDAPAFALQLFLKRRPEWRREAVAVVDEDKPQGVVRWANARSRELGVSAGMRYSAALALAPRLCAGVVAPEELEAGVDELAERLRRFTPHVERSASEPGVLWLDARGLERLHPSLVAWAEAIRASLREADIHAAVAVGFTRFGCYAAAKVLAGRSVVVFDRRAHEEAAARRVPLALVDLEPSVFDALEALGVRTVGQFASLPANGVRLRFGARAHALHRAASGDLCAPLQPDALSEPLEARVDLEEPLADRAQLLARIEWMLAPLLAKLAKSGRALTELHLELGMESAPALCESVRPAAPTLDRAQIVELLRLRLESIELARAAALTRPAAPARPAAFTCAVESIVVGVEGRPADARELSLFAHEPRRDLAAAGRALARLRAEFGGDAVVRARLENGHLPEAQFAWEPLERLQAPKPRAVREHSLVRRVLAQPVALPSFSAHDRDGWLVHGLESGPMQRQHGPYLLSGGWWRTESQREYSFAEMKSGEILWIYYDRRRRQWFLHGSVA